MGSAPSNGRFPRPGGESTLATDDRFHREEVQLAARNRGMPLEGLQYPITPSGMHYLLVHFDVPFVDVSTWHLAVGGTVKRPLRLNLEDLQQRPAVTVPVTLECAGNGRALLEPRPVSQPWLVEAVGTARWTGTPLRGLLEDAGLTEETVEILFTGLDRGVQGDEVQSYQRSLTVDEACRDDVLLAYAMNDQPLPPQHGFPLRLIVPGWYGMTSVKWLTRIEAVSEPFRGYQMVSSYRYSQSPDDPGEPVTLMRVRALMVPPGIPDFVTRCRLVERGPATLTGRAWAGRRSVARVEVSTDGGITWSEGMLEEPVSPHAWRGWHWRWEATPGWHTLCVRATDDAGDVQPTSQFWTRQGMGNNGAQQVTVLVE